MQDEVTIDDIEEDALTPDQIAARCTEYEFAGKRLNPFNRRRQTAAVAMNVRMFLGFQRDENGMYPEIFSDAVKVNWLCSVDDNAARRACVKPQEATEKALDWWETNGGNLGGDLHGELMENFNSIIADLSAVSAKPDETGSNSSADNLGE